VADDRTAHPGFRRIGRKRGGRHVALPDTSAPSPRGRRSAPCRRVAFITVDPRSFSRYDGIANAAASMDPAGLARVYSILKPRLLEAYTELGHPDGNLDLAIERATVHLLQAPVVEEPMALRPRVLSFRYERDDLEALSPAQKQLLRMGRGTCGPSGSAAGHRPRARHPVDAPSSPAGWPAVGA